MKKIYLFTTIVLLANLLTAQNKFSSDRFKISFESSEDIKSYRTESEYILGYENNNIAVDILVVKTEKESNRFLNDLKYGAREIAVDFQLKNITDGGKVPNIDKSFFVKAYEEYQGKKHPIYIIAILNKKEQIAYEISVDCYNLDEAEGLNIVKSFKLLK